MKMTGAEAMRARLVRLARRFPDDVARALYQEAQIEMAEAKRRTPVDTGVLRASGFVHVPVRDFGSNSISVTLSFGGAAEPYALIVHEDMDAWHRVGQAKFLESTLMESAPYIGARVARRIRIEGMVAR